jgi:hypothetical protein
MRGLSDFRSFLALLLSPHLAVRNLRSVRAEECPDPIAAAEVCRLPVRLCHCDTMLPPQKAPKSLADLLAGAITKHAR